MKITIETPDVPNFVELTLERVQNAKISNNIGVQRREHMMTRKEAVDALDIFSVTCIDPNARALFRGLYRIFK